MSTEIRKVLIANRGEISVRIMRACREMGIASVAIYSEADRDALHVALAKEAVLIGPPPASLSYLNGERIIRASLDTHCDAIHPGYGFLAENAEFAQAVRDAGLVFIGPPAEAIRTMGSKTTARKVMQAAGIPVVPGYQGIPPNPDDAKKNPALASAVRGEEDFVIAARRLGYPVMVKAAAGGGGKGMRTVRSEGELPDALASARREALNAFGDDTIYLEKLLGAPHHVEFQLFADRHGHVVHLLERECSVQRRHQKIIEETPSPLMTPELRERMGRAAVSAARAAGYVNAGTIEFLVDAERNFYFLEMNTRLQVEHPITEAVTGLDLAKLQIRVARGEPLPFEQSGIAGRGHALECRVYAEDPANGFLPSTGKVLLSEEPRGPGIRVDTAIESGQEVSRYYDPLIAKVIVHAETRAEAIARMDHALADYTVLGVATNIGFLREVLAHDDFQRGDTTTDFVDSKFAEWAPRSTAIPDDVFVAVALSEMSARPPETAAMGDGEPYSPWRSVDGYRPGLSTIVGLLNK